MVWKGRKNLHEGLASECDILPSPVKTYTFLEIITFLKKGKKVKRRLWREELYIYCNDDLLFFCESFRAYICDIKYVFADDWIVVE